MLSYCIVDLKNSNVKLKQLVEFFLAFPSFSCEFVNIGILNCHKLELVRIY